MAEEHETKADAIVLAIGDRLAQAAKDVEGTAPMASGEWAEMERLQDVAHEYREARPPPSYGCDEWYEPTVLVDGEPCKVTVTHSSYGDPRDLMIGAVEQASNILPLRPEGSDD